MSYLIGRYFTTLTEAKILIEEWRKEYNQVRPHSALNYRPPAPEALLLLTLASGTINGGRSRLPQRKRRWCYENTKEQYPALKFS